jgi:hypothetical protein
MNFGRRPSRIEPLERRLELVDAHAVAVHLDLHDVGLVGAEGGHRARVRRRLGDDHVAGVDQRLADEVDDLLAAGRDEHVLGSTSVPSAAMTCAMHSATALMPSVGAYCSARALLARPTWLRIAASARPGTCWCRAARRRAR